ncbi:MAG: peptide deformylase [Candidatus Cloacimonetes bacterium]|nr:peptide deformylase [Candidatus Cloacimonadota bacterium]
MSNKLEIKLYGCEVLRKKSEPVDEITPELKQFIDDLIYTMYENDGIGIAAPQVGVSKRIFVCDKDYSTTDVKNPVVLINPEFISYQDDQISEEGCLSFPNVFAEVVRFKKVKIQYFDLEMKEQFIETEGVYATVLQHEFDHLNGVHFIDKLSPIKKMTLGFKLNRILEKGKKMTEEMQVIQN